MDRDQRGWIPDDWVPVERRWLGLDRTTIPAALIVLAVVAVAALVLPAVDAAVPLEDEIRPGETLVLGGSALGSRQLSAEPPVGWDLQYGARESARPAGSLPPTTTIVDGDRSVTVVVGGFDGDANDLLEQIDETGAALTPAGPHSAGDPVPITTDAGDPGVLARYEGGGSAGVIACFVIDGIGVEVLALAPTGSADLSESEEVLAMIRSVRLGEEEAS